MPPGPIHKILITLLLAAVLLVSIHTLTDINQDIGMHIALGKIIWQTHHVPTTNYFSYTAADYPSINHRLIFEVLLYLGVATFGLKATIAGKAILIACAFALAFFASYRRDQDVTPVVLGLVALFIMIDRTFLRPEIFSFLFFTLFLFILYRKPAFPMLWWLVLIQFFWVNSHIYFFLGPFAWGCFLAGKLVREKLVSKGDILLTLALIAINLANPNGFRGAIYPFLILRSYGIPILENLSPFGLSAYHYPMAPVYVFIAAFLIAIAGFALNRKNFRNNAFGLLIVMATSVLSLKMVRNMPFFALAFLPVTMKNLREYGFSLRKTWMQYATGILLGALLVIIVTSKLFLWTGIRREFGTKIPDFGFKAVEFVKANHLQGPVFNNINAGSFLVWQLPEEKIFMDARPEDYPPDFEKSVYIPMQKDPTLWQKYSDDYHINYVFYAWQEIYFTDWSNAFLRSMMRNPNWPIVYLDPTIAIFVRNSENNRPLIERTKAWRSTINFN